MGLSTKRTTSDTTSNSTTNQNTTINQNTTGTRAPVNPAFVTSGIEGLAGKIGQVFGADPTSFVAGADPLQMLAAGNAGRLLGLGNNTGVAPGMDIMKSVAGAGPNLAGVSTGKSASLLDNLKAYMNPYTDSVTKAALGDYDYGAGQTRAENKLALAGDTTFGGSGGAIQTALSEDAINRGRGALSAQLNADAFNTAAGLSGDDANRRQQMSLANMTAQNQGAMFNAGQQDNMLDRRLTSGGALVQAGLGADANTRANLATQADMGSMLRDINQQKAQSPLQSLLAQIGAFNGLPLDLLHGENTTGSLSGTGTMNGTTSGTEHGTQKTSGGGLGSLLQAAALALAPMSGGLSMLLPGAAAGTTAGMGAIVSDRRAKTGIRKVGKLDNGLPVYSYRYKAGGPRHIGVMAQEVAKTKPEAVTNLGGLLAVDYGKL